VPPLEVRVGDHHADRCWIDPERKKSLRVLETGDIGLELPAA